MSPNPTPSAASTRAPPPARRSWSPGSAGCAAGAEGAGEAVELLMGCLPWTDAPAADHRGADPPRRPLRVPCHKTARQGAASTPSGGGTRRTGEELAGPAAVRCESDPRRNGGRQGEKQLVRLKHM